MKKNYFFKFFVMAVLAAFVTITSCKDYEDDISRLNSDLAAMKTDAVAKSELTALQSQLQTSITTTASDLAAAKASLATLQANTATQAKIDAAKAEILAIAVKTETLEAMKTQVDSELSTLKADLAKAPTKEYVAALLALTDSQIDSVALAHAARIANLEALLKVADGKSQALDGLQEQLTAQMAEITANKAAIEATKADLQAKYDELKAEIATLKTDLDNLDEALAALDEKVETYKTDLEEAIATLGIELSDAIEELGLQMNQLIVDVFGSLDKRVTSLTFIPDFSSYDGTPQLPVTFLGEWYKPIMDVQNWDPDYRDDRMLTPYKGITYAKYHVSPSNATLADFEVVQLLNKTSEIIGFRSDNEEPLLKAVVEDVTLNNGILTVPILVHADLYDIDDYGHELYSVSEGDGDEEELLYSLYDKNIGVALQVKNKNMEEDDDIERLVVSSAYINTQLSLLFARIEALDEEDEDYELGAVWRDRLPSRMLDNIIHETYRRPEIELWNGYNRDTQKYENFSIDLDDHIQAIGKFNGMWRLLEEFGYDNIEEHFVYELIAVDNEGVNQSSYVNLNGATGVISVKSAPGGGANQAAVGRTPVVLAKVVKNGKVYAAGYIKILITEKVDNSPIPFEFNLEDYMIGCDSEYQFTNMDLSETDFDQIFNHPRVMLGKDAFFEAYKDKPIITEVVSDPADADGTEITFEWNIIDPTQGGNLANYINGFVKNTAPAGNYVVKTTLRGRGTTPDIVITWTINVKLPSISLTANTSILANGKIVVNPTIIEQNGKTSAAYEALLNNAFMHQAYEFVYTPLPADCDEYLTPYFVFTWAPTGYKVAANGTEIWSNSNVLAARIDIDPMDAKKFYVRLNAETPAIDGVSIGNYPPLTEASKGLVGKTVKVEPRGYINGAEYNNISLYPAFDVEFVTPLYLVLPTNAAVYDQANNGNNVYTLNMYDPSVLKDWNNKLLDVTTVAGRALINHYEAFGYASAPLAGYYENTGYTNWFAGPPVPGAEWYVTGMFTGYWAIWHPESTTEIFTSPFQFDLANMKSSIKADGNIDPNNVSYPIPAGMNLKINAVANTGTTTIVEGVPTTVPAEYIFEWDNGSTGAVQNPFKVSVPVTVKHKWGTLNGMMVISVNPGSGPAPAPAP